MSSPIWLSDHAISRYKSRLRPELSHGEARRQLLINLPRLDWSQTAPHWLSETPSSSQAVGYLLDGNRYALPLCHHRSRRGYVALTCLTPGLRRDESFWIPAADLEEVRSLLRFSGAQVVAPWRRLRQIPSASAARNDLYRRVCFSALGVRPESGVDGKAFLWLPGGAVLTLNPRPGGIKASRLTLHDRPIIADSQIIDRLRQIS